MLFVRRILRLPARSGMSDAFRERIFPKYANVGKGPCRFKKSCVGATMDAVANIQSGSEAKLQAATAKIGPTAVGIDASHQRFQDYTSGVYDEPACSSTELDHMMLIVGYGVHDGTDYWIVKNSWGTDWGMKGYILMSRNKSNQCGIATTASYPTGVGI